MRPGLSPVDLARALDRPVPTPEQAAVVGAPLGPGVVVAGAGSGKTETMAARVVWLVANGLVRPEQVLGLTFTRKAARELASRVRSRLAALRSRGVLDPVGAESLLAGEPSILTYDAYAGRIVGEHALRLGHEPASRVIGEAAAWQVAQRVVDTYAGPMGEVDLTSGTVTDRVLSLHGELCGHLVDGEAVARHAAELSAVAERLPRGKGQRGEHFAEVATVLGRQAARGRLLPLVEEFRAAIRRAEVVDFADRARLAAQLATSFPDVGRLERQRYTVVLLDEYQDTSHVQLVLLAAIFGEGGHAVTAVGDPGQSVYGWRGASVGTLESLARTFRRSDGRPAAATHLSVSFRNDARVLAAANTLSGPLRGGGLAVRELRPRAGAGPGAVRCSLHLTADDEAREVAVQARHLWDSRGVRRIAVLVRMRVQIPRIDEALRAVGLPVEVVGVGGLLTTPEVSDVVATLRVLADPGRGDALMRLLTGSRWRLGPRDLEALGRWARLLARRRVRGRDGRVVDQLDCDADQLVGAREPGRTAHRPDRAADDLDRDTDEVDGLSLVEAVDDLPAPGWLSPAAHERLSRLRGELRSLRRRLGQPLPDLVADIERTTGLTVEVAAAAGPAGRANLDRFLDVAADYAAAGDDPSPRSFLAYLDAAAEEERGLDRGDVEVEGDRVQVLTVHGAKGLEWDAVFVVGMVDGRFPAGGDRDKAWLIDVGQLPFDLRGDRDALPHLRLDDLADGRDLRDRVRAHVDECGARQRTEERRLGYVAVTRAERFLACSGYRWDDGVRPREPGEFLVELRRALRPSEVPVWVEEPGGANPLTAGRPVPVWPLDPLSPRRRGELAAGAALVQLARGGGVELPADGEPLWARDVDLLLAERERARRQDEVRVELPAHVSVSQLVQLRRDPAALALALRRPVPLAPAPQARRGTSFHGWLEARYARAGLLDVDELPGSADADAAPDHELAELQRAFLSSPWAERSPVEVEAAFELTVAGLLVRGRADAVFATADDGLDVVDWKTGPPPREPEEQSVRSVQLAAYRLAYSRLRGVPLEQVTAAFHHVREGVTVRPVDLLDAGALERLVRSVPAATA